MSIVESAAFVAPGEFGTAHAAFGGYNSSGVGREIHRTDARNVQNHGSPTQT